MGYFSYKTLPHAEELGCYVIDATGNKSDVRERIHKSIAPLIPPSLEVALGLTPGAAVLPDGNVDTNHPVLCFLSSALPLFPHSRLSLGRLLGNQALFCNKQMGFADKLRAVRTAAFHAHSLSAKRPSVLLPPDDPHHVSCVAAADTLLFRICDSALEGKLLNIPVSDVVVDEIVGKDIREETSRVAEDYQENPSQNDSHTDNSHSNDIQVNGHSSTGENDSFDAYDPFADQ